MFGRGFCFDGSNQQRTRLKCVWLTLINGLNRKRFDNFALFLTPDSRLLAAEMPHRREIQPDRPAPRWIENPWVRRGISVALLVHLAALFAAPFHIAAVRERGASPFSIMLYETLQPYIQAARLDQGYQFFAPNPGPTHLVRYKIEFEDQREPLVGRFPDLEKQRPRLFYHRHMMLSESLNAAAPPPPPMRRPGEMLTRFRDLDAVPEEERTREDVFATDFTNHLLARHEGKRITLTVVRHIIPGIDEFREGASLHDESSYIDLVEFVKVRK